MKGIAVPLPYSQPLIGFDISYVDATNRQYYLATPQVGGVTMLDLDSMVDSAPNVSVFVPTGANAFAGNQTDMNDVNTYPGGPLGVATANGGKELWAGDSNTYTGNPNQYGVNSNLADYSNDNCDSSLKVITLAAMSTVTIPINGCFETDELAYDPNDNVLLVGNPDEKPNGGPYFGVNSSGNFAAYFVSIPPAARKAGVPTGPFISLISTTSKTLTMQIAFDGNNGTPNADGGIEMPVYSSATGRFYVSVPGNSTDPGGDIAVVNPTTGAVTTHPLTDGCNPSGLALGPDGNEVFVACNSTDGPQIVSLLNSSTPGAAWGPISSLTQFAAANDPPTDGTSLSIYFGPSCDEAYFNSALNDYMAVCNFSYDNANFTVVNAGAGPTIPDAEAPELVYTNPSGAISAGAAHSIASDKVTGAVLVPLPMGDPLCLASGGVGCIGVWAPMGSTLQIDGQR